MKKLIILALAALLMAPAFAQNKKSQSKAPADPNESIAQAPARVYDETRDPMEMLDMAIEEARADGRMVLAQVGGNWCPWCLLFAQLVAESEEIAQLVKENYVYVHLNVPKEKENRNYDMLKRLQNPGRFGYPALVVLNEEGQVLHIQNSSYLELGKGYDTKKVLQFLQQWTRKAIDDIK